MDRTVGGGDAGERGLDEIQRADLAALEQIDGLPRGQPPKLRRRRHGVVHDSVSPRFIRIEVARSLAILYLKLAMAGTLYERLAARLRDFTALESASGPVLLAAAILALIASNSPLAPLYDLFLQTPVVVRVGALHLDKPLL